MLSSLSMVKALTPKAWGSSLGTKRGRAQNLTGQSTTEHITSSDSGPTKIHTEPAIPSISAQQY